MNDENRKWSKAALLIAGNALVPGEISAILGIEPTRSGIKGEQYGSTHMLIRRSSFWCFECPLSGSLPLEQHLRWLLNVLEPKRGAIASVSAKWKVEFFCGFSSANGQGGITFDPGLLRRLADLGVPVVFDLYPPDALMEFALE